MKKIFQDRVAVTVYLERTQRDMHAEAAKEHGMLLSDWLRKCLGDWTSKTTYADGIVKGSDLAKERGREPVVASFSLPATEDKWLAPFHKHTAESNWRTCLCSTCIKKRKDHNL